MERIVLFLVASLFISACSKNLTVTSRQDAVVSKIVPDNNYGKLEDIHIYSWTQAGELNVNRVLIDFDLTNIPANATIKSAHLSLYFNPQSAYDKVLGNKGNQGDDNIIIQRVTSPWNESSVTWRTQPTATSEDQLIVSKSQAPRSDYVAIDVTAIIQDIISSGEARYGLMVRHQAEVPYNVVFFASGNHPNAELHPKLIIKFK